MMKDGRAMIAFTGDATLTAMTMPVVSERIRSE